MTGRYSILLLLPSALLGASLDLSHATIKLPRAPTPQALTAATLLIDEIRARTYLTLNVKQMTPAQGTTITLVESTEGKPESYKIATTATGITLTGTAPRGLLYAAGKLLRSLDMKRFSAILPTELNIASAPATALRGHQLGYRPKTNSYDGWSVSMWEQYIRDLAIFGTNAIELIPPRSDDAADSPLFTLPPMDMMIQMSRIAASYGLEVWVWYPAMDRDYTTDASRDKAVAEWSEVFRQLPRIDHVFVPGGDPGHTRPAVLLKLLERESAALRRYHPKAGMWVSPQGFNEEWLQEFYQLLKPEPTWLTGIVHGPQVRPTIAQLRANVPQRYPIRNYPDITHSLQSQNSVPDWDPVFALTLNREPINPRPVDMRKLFLEARPDTIGFLTYSEGCNDDVNKIVWSALGWDPNADLHEVLLEYARYFIGPEQAQSFSQLLFDLEENWRGPIATNAQIEKTLARAQAIEKAAAPRDLLQWRLQQALYRAYYDAYERRRFLAGDPSVRVNEDLRTRVFALAEALFQSIRMQLSVPLYRAISRDRGATLDNIDWPITDRKPAPHAGPGALYDDLGNPANEPHLVRNATVRTGFGSTLAVKDGRSRLATFTVEEALYDAPLVLRYPNLDRVARYRVRIIYGGERTRPERLVANEKYEVHPMQKIEDLYAPLDFDIPQQATASGELTLTWTIPPGLGGNGRQNQVAEVWLIKQ
ncbi:MAG TPA: glycoside hydrolase family 20 zincin-like fold domain-containing protein [Bryobacteraceae bacterium]